MAKSDNLLTVLELLVEGEKLTASDKELQDRLGVTKRNLQRYLTFLYEKYDEIEIERVNRRQYYRLIKISNMIHTFLSASDDISWLIHLMAESDKRIFCELEDETKNRLENILSSEKDIFLYQNSPFEVFEEKEHKQIFRDLKLAVKNNEYRDIDYEYNRATHFTKVKCLKLIFMENNWYVAIATQEDVVLFLRISFIQAVNYADGNSYQPSQLRQYASFFKNFQNPMTRFGVQKQIAHIVASPKVSKYFKPNMKKLLSSQKFKKELADGSVEFTLEYTQFIEILPLIKKWLPDLKILSPQSLKDELEADLRAYLG